MKTIRLNYLEVEAIEISPAHEEQYKKRNEQQRRLSVTGAVVLAR
jgi:hypothetical protein